MIHHNYCNNTNIGVFILLMIVAIYFIDLNTHENGIYDIEYYA